ncbi:MAG: ferritin-like domain-containing protein [Kofleriaceae bacterium]
MTTPRTREEWRARIAAEYMSAAIAQQVTLWLIQAGAPPELIDAGLAIVADELAHSRLSHEVYAAAGGTTPPVLVREHLGLPRHDAVLELDLLAAVVRVFCLGETVAVPLFNHLRAACTEPIARAALDRILVDEVRHREFGWDTLDWLATTAIGDRIPAWITAHWPALHGELVATYGTGNPATASTTITAADRAWGLAAAADYVEILTRTIEKDYRPRFLARGVTI